MKIVFGRSHLSVFFALVVIASLLAGCFGQQAPAGNQTSTTEPIPAATQMPQSMVTFKAEIPAPLSAGESLNLDILDEVTGLALNKTSYPMEGKDARHFIKEISIPIGSVVKYRYSRGTTAQEHSADGREVRYRMLIVDGPVVVQDTISRWTDSRPTGSFGRITGQVTDAATKAPLANILIACAGQQTYTASDGSYILEGVPVGTNNLVAYTIDGSYRPYQQGALIAPDATTPAPIRLNPTPMVKVTFTVTPPKGTIQGVPIRLAGNLYQLGNTFANLAGGVSVLASRSPAMAMGSDGRYSISLNLPAGADVRYKYTLGDGLWNAEHTADGANHIRQLVVPAQTTQVNDQIDTWTSGKSAPITFDTTVPANTPPDDRIAISFNPGYGWTEPVPMWALGNNRWVYVLYSPLDGMKEIGYRYCRNEQCDSAGDVKSNIGKNTGQSASISLTAKTMNEPVTEWAGLFTTQPPVTIPNVTVQKRPEGFMAGVELQPAYHPSWQSYYTNAINDIRSLSANWLALDPTWTFTRANSPVLEPIPGQDMLLPDTVNIISLAHAQSLKVALFPTPTFPSGADSWFLSGQRDFGWWNTWFERYRNFLLNFADLASKQNAEAFIIGGDWVNPALPNGKLADGSPSGVPEDTLSRWQGLLAEVKDHYKGLLLWALSYPERMQDPPAFLNQVDGVYLLWSAPLADKAGATPEEMSTSAGQILDNEIRPWQININKPIVLGLGYASARGSTTGCIQGKDGLCVPAGQLSRPNADLPDVTLDLDEQARAYGAIFLAANSREWINGVISRGYFPPTVLEDKSLSIHGKPSRGVLWYWFPRWLGVSTP